MSMTNEQIQALQAAAEKAGADEWQAKVISGDGYVIRKGSFRKEGGWNTYQPIAEFDDKKVRDFVAAANPAVILSLLAERDADKALMAEQAKTIDFLKEQLAQLANFNPDWDKLEAATDSLCEHMAELIAANKRIAELEARAITVKLPGRKSASYYVEGEFDNSDLASIYNTCLLECKVKIKNACAAAGITLVVEE